MGFVERSAMLSRRELLTIAAGLPAGIAFGTAASAQSIVVLERGTPDRQAILDVVRGSVERRLGIKVIFVVGRLTLFGDWAFVGLRPRTEAGRRIDYRRTHYARNFDPEQDSDTVHALLRRSGTSWAIVEEAFLPTDVVWEEWIETYKLPRGLFLDE
jgi:hypothetical protein